jgi:tRNA(Ser,Leu) C12 N-acetylase TAN1
MNLAPCAYGFERDQGRSAPVGSRARSPNPRFDPAQGALGFASDLLATPFLYLPMFDWNTVVTLHQEERAFRRARGLLRPLGEPKKTEFYNVLVMQVDSAAGFLRDFSAMCAAQPGILNDISRAVPLTDVFDFATSEDFEAKARNVAISWAPRLRGSAFHVRLHRRGLKRTLKSPDEERFLDEALLSALAREGAPGRIRFEDPDFVIDIETVGQRAGMSLWSREDLEKYPFLKAG